MPPPTTTKTALVKTRMKSAPGVALLVDPGSPENLCGVHQWSQRMREAAKAAGKPELSYKRVQQPMEVGGVGTGSQCATHAVIHHIGLDNEEPLYEVLEFLHASTAALLGQKSLKKVRCLLDCFNNKLYRIRPGGYKLLLSPGSGTLALEESHAGYLMLPCTRYSSHGQATGVKETMLTEQSDVNECGNPHTPS